MPGSARAEIYFIAAMMVLIFVVCGVAIYYFFKTYKKEMAEKASRKTASTNDIAKEEHPE